MPGVSRKESPLTKKLLAIITSAAFLSACGGGSGSNDSDAATGYLTYTGIRGLSYETASQSGTTGIRGEYRYYPGETVTFRLGDMVLAENIPAQRRLSPLDLEPSLRPLLTTGSLSNGLTTHLMAERNTLTKSDRLLNWLGFLIAFDVDQNSGNGIQITDEILDQFSKAQLDEPVDFSKPPLEFGEHNQIHAPENRLLWSLCFFEEFDDTCKDPLQGRKVASEAVTRDYMETELKHISSEISDAILIEPFAFELSAGDTSLHTARIRIPQWSSGIAELEVVSSNNERLTIQNWDTLTGDFSFFSAGTAQSEAEIFANIRLEGDYRWTRKSVRVLVR